MLQKEQNWFLFFVEELFMVSLIGWFFKYLNSSHNDLRLSKPSNPSLAPLGIPPSHYSFDWSQNVSVPYFSQQPSRIYFLTARKVHLFGIQNERNGEQANYVLDESELLDKGTNSTLSLVFNGIEKFSKGEKHLKLTCDNAAGQNKNNINLWFCLYLVICKHYRSVKLITMIAGHTKFKVDGNFGMIKKLYRKSTVYSKEDFVKSNGEV